MDSVKVSDEVTSTASLVNFGCGGVGSVRVLLQKCWDVPVRHPFEGICGVSGDVFVMGCFHPMCQKERVVVFLRPSRVAHGKLIHAVRL